MAETNAQYSQDLPFGGPNPQSTGLEGTASDHVTNDQYSGGVQAFGVGAQSSPKIPGDVHEGGQPLADQGTVAYTDPFSILGAQGSKTPQDHGSTGVSPEYAGIEGQGNAGTGVGDGSASAPAPGRGSASQSSPWTKAGA